KRPSSRDGAGLSERFVDHDRHRIGKIEAAHARFEDRDGEGVLKMLRDELATQSPGLAAEDQEIARLILRLQVGFLGARGKKLHRRAGMRGHELVPSLLLLKSHPPTATHSPSTALSRLD